EEEERDGETEDVVRLDDGEPKQRAPEAGVIEARALDARVAEELAERREEAAFAEALREEPRRDRDDARHEEREGELREAREERGRASPPRRDAAERTQARE